MNATIRYEHLMWIGRSNAQRDKTDDLALAEEGPEPADLAIEAWPYFRLRILSLLRKHLVLQAVHLRIWLL